MTQAGGTNETRSTVIFAETQRFDQPWLVWLVRAVVLVSMALPLALFLLGEPGSQEGSGGLRILTLALALGAMLVVLVVAWLLKAARLESVVRKEGVIVRFVPFHEKDRMYPAASIAGASVVRYAPIRHYGGWGIRKGFRGRGWAYNVRGDRGLLLELVDGRRVLVGTQRPDEIERAVRALGTPELRGADGSRS